MTQYNSMEVGMGENPPQGPLITIMRANTKQHLGKEKFRQGTCLRIHPTIKLLSFLTLILICILVGLPARYRLVPLPTAGCQNTIANATQPCNCSQITQTESPGNVTLPENTLGTDVPRQPLKGADIILDKLRTLNISDTDLRQVPAEDPVIVALNISHSYYADRGKFAALDIINQYRARKLHSHRAAMPDLDERDLIALGYEVMKMLKVVICGISRNNGQRLPGAFRNFKEIGNLFGSYQVLIVENDSTDNTKEILRKYADDDARVDVHVYDLAIPRAGSSGSMASSRFQLLSMLRNIYMAKLHEDRYQDADIVMVYDVDIDKPISLQGLAHTYGLMAAGLTWEAACANGLVPNNYGWAYTGKRNGPYSELAKRRYYDSLAFRDDFFTAENFRFHEQISHKPKDPAYYVQACFGGIAMYVREAMMHCTYDATNDCEHTALNGCLRGHGYNLLFNPRFVVDQR